ncbi:MAG: flagellar protein FlaG [Pontibacterium sp.]
MSIETVQANPNSAAAANAASNAQAASASTASAGKVEAVEATTATAATQADKADKASDTAVSAEQLEKAVDKLNELMKDGQRSLAFSVDSDSEEVVVKVMDKTTDEVIRQIPNEEALRFAEHVEGMMGVIFNDKA